MNELQIKIRLDLERANDYVIEFTYPDLTSFFILIPKDNIEPNNINAPYGLNMVTQGHYA